MIGKNLRKIITLNVLHAKKEKIYPTWNSEHDSKCEKQIILLMIPKGEGWHYIAVKNYHHY